MKNAMFCSKIRIFKSFRRHLVPREHCCVSRQFYLCTFTATDVTQINDSNIQILTNIISIEIYCFDISFKNLTCSAYLNAKRRHTNIYSDLVLVTCHLNFTMI